MSGPVHERVELQFRITDQIGRHRHTVESISQLRKIMDEPVAAEKVADMQLEMIYDGLSKIDQGISIFQMQSAEDYEDAESRQERAQAEVKIQQGRDTRSANDQFGELLTRTLLDEQTKRSEMAWEKIRTALEVLQTWDDGGPAAGRRGQAGPAMGYQYPYSGP